MRRRPPALSAIDGYLARLMWRPLVGTLVIAALLFLLDKMRRVLALVVEEGGPVGLVWQLLGNMLPAYISFGLTIGLLLAVLLTFRRLALNAELDVLQAVGLSHWRLLRVPYLYAIVVAGAGLFVIGWVEPVGRYKYQLVSHDLKAGAFGAAVRGADFVHLGDQSTMRIDRIRGEELYGLFVQHRDRRGGRLTVTAAHGRFLASADRTELVLALDEGILVREVRGRPPGRLIFTHHALPVGVPEIGTFRGRGAGDPQEETLSELAASIRDPAIPAATRAGAAANFHFRLVQVATLLVVPLLGMVCAVPPRRSTSGVGIFLAVVVLVAWYKLDQYAVSLGRIGWIDPALALWLPFALVSGVIALAFYRMNTRPEPEAVWRFGG